jgi:sugar O-acyltransferase (sialic acid O-acetyltransferase NeuD family)
MVPDGVMIGCPWKNVTMSPLLIYGCGGFGREVAAAVRAAGRTPAGFIDDGSRGAHAGVPVLGDLAAARAWIERQSLERIEVFIAVGSIAVHHKLTERVMALGARVELPSIIHPAATIDAASVRMGRGCYIGAGARLTADVTLGDFVLVNVNTVLAHDVVVGDRTQINPGAVVNSQVRVGCEVVVGAGAVLLPRITVGDGAVLGLGAVAGANVPAGATVVGNPGRILRPGTS